MAKNISLIFETKLDIKFIHASSNVDGLLVKKDDKLYWYPITTYNSYKKPPIFHLKMYGTDLWLLKEVKPTPFTLMPFDKDLCEAAIYLMDQYNNWKYCS